MMTIRTLLGITFVAAFACSAQIEHRDADHWKRQAQLHEGRLLEIDLILSAWIDTEAPVYGPRARKMAVYELVRYRRQNPDPFWDKHAEWTKPSKVNRVALPAPLKVTRWMVGVENRGRGPSLYTFQTKRDAQACKATLEAEFNDKVTAVREVTIELPWGGE